MKRFSFIHIMLLVIIFSTLLSACNIPVSGSREPANGTAQASSGQPEINTDPTALPATSTTAPTAVPPTPTTKPQAAPTKTKIPPTATGGVPVVGITPVVIVPTTSGYHDEGFDVKLAQVMQIRDTDMMRAYMRDGFRLAVWRGEGRMLLLNDAVVELRNSFFAPGSNPTAIFRQDLSSLLNGVDPLNFMTYNGGNPIRAFLVQGGGPNGKDEGIAYISRDTTGQLYWMGFMVSLNGFPDNQPDPEGVDSIPTDVKAIVAKEAVNMRSGPGFNYAVEGQMRVGEIAAVTGISPNHAWWHVVCTTDSSGQCWVSADPTLTQPSAVP